MSINQRYIDEIKKMFNSDQELDDFLNNCSIPLKKSIKINLHKFSSNEFLEETNKYGRKLQDPGFIKNQKISNDCFYIDRDNIEHPLGKTFFHQSGFFYIQEIAAGMPARFLDIKENDLILDISAAPGGKSCQIGDYLLTINKNNPGFVVSNDVNKSRIMALSHNLNRMGIYNSGISCFNGFSFGKNLGEIFDHVLVDAPCSGEGTCFKSDFALKFWKIEEINKIAGTQFQLIVSAIKATKPGGTIIFSTCTLNPYENETNVKKILDFFQGSVVLEDVNIFGKSDGISNYNGNEILSLQDASKLARFWPHIQKTGGFFISKFRKIKSSSEKNLQKENKLNPQNPFRIDTSSGLQSKILNYLNNEFGIKLNQDSIYFIATKSQVFATSPKFKEIKDLIHFEKVGTPILKIDNSGNMRPVHHLGVIFGDLATKNFVELDFEKAQKYSLGENLDLKEICGGNIDTNTKEIIIKYKNKGLSIGKIIEGTIKNKYLKI